MGSPEEVLEGALERLAPFGPDLRNGLTNHAPMAAEALCVLGRTDAVGPFLDHYGDELLPRPLPSGRIDRRAWREALGVEARFADWGAFFERELGEDSWPEVVRLWAPRLAPGFAAAATHGVIRAGHAVRSLGRRDTSLRRRELADGLAYWAATFQALPGAPGAQTRGFRPAEAIATVAIVPVERRRFEGTITSSLAALDDGFAPVIDALDATMPADRAISELAETFARVTLANAHDFVTAIVFVHSVTSASAVRSLLPYVDPTSAMRLVRHQWQTAAALYAAFGARPPSAASPARRESSWDDEIDRAVASGDEHAIKFAEACRREDRLAPAPALRAAVAHVTPLLAAG